MPKFRKKPVVIEAVQWLGDNIGQVGAFCKTGMTYTESFIDESIADLEIHTLEGVMKADKGDWIIKGVKGEFYPCKPDTFAATYEPVDH